VTLRKVAGLLAAFGLTVGLIGGGVGAQFYDHVTAQENINVGTFQCLITGATAGAVIAGDQKSVTYTAPAIMSSTPGSAPFYFTVKDTGSMPQSLTVSAAWAGSLSGHFSSILATPTAATIVAAGGTQTYNAGIQWSALDSGDLTTSGSITYTVNCNEAPYGAANYAAATCSAGTPIINVTETVLNDEDSGVSGNYWAIDSPYTRQITVWNTGANNYCATVSYSGQFTTRAGASPAGSPGTVTGGIQGTWSGGYRATFTGTLLVTPLWPTSGSVGTVDYNCNGLGTCTNLVSYLNQYFSSNAGFDQTWWGWQYNTDSHGIWVNSIDGNSGDITG